jgi:AcrR family transcriptional regulator
MSDVLEPRHETRRRRKAERPQEILEAAFEQFSRNGYAATTLDQIAERAGVTKGTIYVYFENKEQLFISMVRDAMRSKFDALRAMQAEHTGSTADLFRKQFHFIYRHVVEDQRRREVARLLIAEAGRFPELADRYYDEVLRPCLSQLHEAIQRGVERGEIRPSKIVESPQVVIAPIAFIDLWLMLFDARIPLDVPSYLEAHLDLVLNGLMAKPASAPRARKSAAKNRKKRS